LVSLFSSYGVFNLVHGIHFVFKDIFYTFGGLVLALNWECQYMKIYAWLETTWMDTLRDFFKTINSSYLTGISLVLFLCAVSRLFYLPLVEIFSWLSISLMIVGAYHHFYQKTQYELGVSTTNS